jgi:hypothetical protein
VAFFGANNKEIVGEGVTLAASAARTASGNGTAVDTRESSTLRLLLDVTAASGTGPTLTVTIEQSSDGSTWRDHSSFAQATGVTSERKTFGGVDRWVRAKWTLGGTTPSFTFSVVGELI